jgi:beta-N-acetylhexosaminidase
VTLNKHAIDLLRTELGFTGAVITDGLDMKAVGGDLAQGAVRALAAGVDAMCLGGMALDDNDLQWLIDSIVAAVKSGELSEERLTQAAARSLALGLPPSTVDAHDAEIGLTAARRAVEVRGRVGVGADPVVVDLVVDPSIAVGDVPWGLGPYLREVLPGTEVIAARDITADEVAKTAGDRTIVVVTRDAHRHTAARQLVTNLTNLGLDVVHVETGVPGPDLGSVARIDTHGGSRVSLRAAAELILKGTT